MAKKPTKQTETDAGVVALNEKARNVSLKLQRHRIALLESKLELAKLNKILLENGKELGPACW